MKRPINYRYFTEGKFTYILVPANRENMKDSQPDFKGSGLTLHGVVAKGETIEALESRKKPAEAPKRKVYKNKTGCKNPNLGKTDKSLIGTSTII